jgi:hypothetical protein
MNVNKYIASVVVLVFGACVFAACSGDDDELTSGVDTTDRADK